LRELYDFYKVYSTTETFKENYDSSIWFDRGTPSAIIDIDKNHKTTFLPLGGDSAKLHRREFFPGKGTRFSLDATKRVLGGIEVNDKDGSFTFEENFGSEVLSQVTAILKYKNYFLDNLSLFTKKEVLVAQEIFDAILSIYVSPKCKDFSDIKVSKTLKKLRKDFCTHFKDDKNVEGKLIGISYQGELILENKVISKIVESFKEYELGLINKKTPFRNCPICKKNTNLYNINSYGAIRKSLLGGSINGCFPISYNEPQFESYGMKGNLNSSICYDCGKKIVRSLEILCGIDKIYVPFKNSKGEDKLKPSFKETRFRLDVRGANEYAILVYATDANGRVLDMTKEISLDTVREVDLKLDESSIISSYKSLNDSSSSSEAIIPLNITANILVVASNSARMVIRDHCCINLNSLRSSISRWREATQGQTFEGYVDAKGNQKWRAIKYYPSLNTILENLGAFGKNDKVYYSVIDTVQQMVFRGITENISFKDTILNNIQSSFFTRGDRQYEISKDSFCVVRLVYNAGKNKESLMSPSLDETNEKMGYLFGRAFSIASSIMYHVNDKDTYGIDSLYDQCLSQPKLAIENITSSLMYYVSKGKKDPDIGFFIVSLHNKYMELISKALQVGVPIIMKQDDKLLFIGGMCSQNMYNKTGGKTTKVKED